MNFLRRFGALFRRKKLEAEMADEMRAHLELLAAENERRGMPPDEARYTALRKFGGVEQIKERARDARSVVWLEQWRQDVRFAFRSLSRAPGFAFVLVATLALAIGANTAIFSVVNAVLLRPLSYPSGERLAWLATEDRSVNEEMVPRYDFHAWREQAQSFDRMVAYSSEDDTLTATDAALQVRVARVSGDFWGVSGAAPALGRLPNPDETNLLVLTHASFDRDFHGDRGVVGRAVTLDGRQVTVVGVLREDFRFQLVPPPRRGPDAKEIDAFAPLDPAPQDRTRSRGRTVSVVGRLKENVLLPQARAELDTIRRRIAQDTPKSFLDEMPLRVMPLQDRLVASARLGLWVLLAAVGLVLLIACANVASLLLARATVRQKEIAIRASLGAGQGRLLRQFLTESLVLAAAGCAGGLLLAQWGLTALVRFVPAVVPRLAEATIDGKVLGFAVAASVLTAFFFGLAPAFSLWKPNLVAAMREDARAGSSSPARTRARRLLVAVEVSLAVVLLSCAGLLIKSFWRMNERPPGYHPESILLLKVPLSGPSYAEAQVRHAYADEAIRRVQAVPGVTAVGVTPGYQILTSLVVKDGRALTPEQAIRPIAVNATSAGYQQAMGLRLISGRWLREAEPMPVIVINESLARWEFGDADPLGKELWVQALGDSKPTFAPVVGVVADIKDVKLDAAPAPQLYVPYTHVSIGASIAIVVRTANDPASVAATLRKTLAGIDPTQAVYDVKTLEQALDESVASRRFLMFLLAGFAATALLLALIGIYGVVAYLVAQRRREIGVRLALGAQRRDVVGMVLAQGLRIAGIGLAVGLAGALAATHVFASLLYDTRPNDPATFVCIPVLLGGAMLLASWLPARRAAKVDPMVALRAE